MSPRGFRALGIGVLMLALGASAWTQTTRRGPRGKVKVMIQVEPSHLEPKIVRVGIESVEGGNRQTAVLKGDRVCVFENVAQGEYVLSVESEEFIPLEQTFTLNPINRSDELLVTAMLRVSAGESFPDEESSTVRLADLEIPPEAEAEMQLAAREVKRNRPEAAIKHLERALEIFPRFYHAYNNLAVQHLRLGQVREAEAALLKSIEIEPGNGTTHRNLAEIRLSQGRLREALRSLDTSVGLQGHSGRSLMILGEIHRAAGECDDAIQILLAASQLDSRYHSYLGLAECYARAGDLDKARNELRGFLRHHPDDSRCADVRSTLRDLDSSRIASAPSEVADPR